MGITDVSAADFTPGVRAARSTTCLKNCCACASVNFTRVGSKLIANKWSVRYPGPARSTRVKPRYIIEVMISNTNDPATWPTTSRFRPQMRCFPPLSASADFKDRTRSVRVDWKAGISPKSSTLTTDPAIPKSSVRVSSLNVNEIGNSVGIWSWFRKMIQIEGRYQPEKQHADYRSSHPEKQRARVQLERQRDR